MKNKTWNVWASTASIAFILTAWFLWPWLWVIVLTMLMAYLFYPLFSYLRRFNTHLAATLTLIISFLVVIIPLLIITVTTISELLSFADSAAVSGHWNHMPEFVKTTIHAVNDIVEPITGQRPSLSEQSVIEYLRTTLPALARASVGLLLGIIASLPALGVALLIYVFLFIELLLRGPDLVDAVRKISPFSPKVTEAYLSQTGLMANAMVKGQLAISFILSLLSAALLIPLGYGNYFFIFLISFTILNFIPLGCGIIVLPLALFAMFTGQFWLGLIVIILYYLIGNLDPVLRPRFIPKSINLSTAWAIISTFCGIAYFGILGVVYGPVVMILLINTWKFYIEAKTEKSV